MPRNLVHDKNYGNLYPDIYRRLKYRHVDDETESLAIAFLCSSMLDYSLSQALSGSFITILSRDLNLISNLHVEHVVDLESNFLRLSCLFTSYNLIASFQIMRFLIEKLKLI